MDDNEIPEMLYRQIFYFCTLSMVLQWLFSKQCMWIAVIVSDLLQTGNGLLTAGTDSLSCRNSEELASSIFD